ncbi:MAG: sugar transferase [Flavobacteriaceae bacterium]
MYKHFLKRVIDLVLSVTGFLFLIPIFIIIYIVLIFVNRGNPIFLQPRPGRKEKVFNIMKFKTMTDEKGSDGKLLPDDLRLTLFGKFLRKTSLDEIPQLLNVIKGDMSLVGPRPLRVRYLPYYTTEESIRHTVRPGITGLAQVSGRNAINWDDKLQKDVDYVKNLTLWLDIKILLKTVKKVFDSSDINLDNSEDALDTYRSLVNS